MTQIGWYTPRPEMIGGQAFGILVTGRPIEALRGNDVAFDAWSRGND